MDADLYKQLAEVVGAGESRIIPRVFRILADEQEARLLMAAAPPATVEQLSERTGISTQRIGQLVGPLFEKGLLFLNRKGEMVRYYRVRHVPQLHDATAVWAGASRELLDLWKEYTATEWIDYTRKIEAFVPHAPVRVIPVDKSIEPQSHILAFEDVKGIVEGARSLAVTKCSCRVIDGACGKPLEVCIQVNRAADYAVERGTGRLLGKEEALQLLRKCEEDGLVHVVDNRQEVDHVICNCCSDCCLNWPSLRAGSKGFVVPSRFGARVDEGLCTACEICLERCYFDAISMTGVGDRARIDPTRCMGCGLCAITCPAEAISLREVRPADSVPA
jgi:Pyruvate/2-oxoacid:ferredoxin oxidoreductase delta subunit/DNA-binding transcriptional ArsR family regulator